MKAIAVAVAALFLAAPAVAHEKGRERERDLDVFRFNSDDFGALEMHAGMRGGRLGVQVTSMTEELRDVMGAPKDTGILVSRVMDDTPAKKAGIKPGDVIVEVAGEQIQNVGDVWKALSGKEGDVGVEVIRDKRRVNLTAKIEKRELAPGMQIFQNNAALEKEVEELRDRVKELEKRLEKLEKR